MPICGGVYSLQGMRSLSVAECGYNEVSVQSLSTGKKGPPILSMWRSHLRASAQQPLCTLRSPVASVTVDESQRDPNIRALSLTTELMRFPGAT